MTPLNPSLYNALKKAFGHVQISNPGVRMTAEYLPGPDGRLRLQPIIKGEYYTVACPYCPDTGKHLYINHRWGVYDRKLRRRNYFLACCFKEDCLQERDNLRDLIDRVRLAEEGSGEWEAPPVQEGTAASPLRPMDLPCDAILLSDLPKGHPARCYLRRRGFDPQLLADDWCIGYSRSACSWSKVGRLLIPLFAPIDGRWHVVGWQARAIDPDEQPKYYTSAGTPKSRLLYGLDHVDAGDGPVLIVEGVTDAWKAGGNAVALLGKVLSAEQRKLIRRHLAGRPLVVMLDPDAAEQAAAVAGQIRETLNLNLLKNGPASPVVVARLPDDRDPGELTRNEIWKAAHRALAGKRVRR
jgi:hypothetical protein